MIHELNNETTITSTYLSIYNSDSEDITVFKNDFASPIPHRDQLPIEVLTGSLSDSNLKGMKKKVYHKL